MPNYLAIYLNDHLAGATAGLALARQAARNAHSTEARASLERLAGEIAEDRASLLTLMRQRRIEPDPLKLMTAYVGERFRRLKPNGHLFRRSPLTPLIELEILSLGVEGKLALWRALREATERPEVTQRLDALIDRGESQRAELERLRLGLSSDVFRRLRG